MHAYSSSKKKQEHGSLCVRYDNYIVIQKEAKEQTLESVQVLPLSVQLDLALTVTKQPKVFMKEHGLTNKDVFLIKM